MIGYTPVEEDLRALNGTDQPPKPPTERERYIDGLRVLASVLENNPGARLPNGRMVIHFLGGDTEGEREAMAETARAFPCNWDKRFYGSEENAYFDLVGKLGGVTVELAAFRDVMCKRVVTGTREVTETVKDPEKLAEVPEIEVTRTEDVIEWDCGSLLAPRPALVRENPKAVEAA